MSFASPILTATLRAKDETGNTLKGIVRGFTRAFTDIAKVAAGILLRDVTRAMVSIGKESITLGAKIETLQNSFTAFKGDVDDSVLSLDTLRASVDGTVSDVDLLTAANQALALGLPVDQLNDLFAAARKVGAAMGRTTLQSVQDLTTGIGRQSKLILDNLGIIVNAEAAYDDYAATLGKATSELTDNERKTAFTNAAITQLNDKAEILGDNISNITTMNEKFTTSITNLKTEIGTFLIPIISDLTKQFTEEWLPSIQDIVEMFRSRDFTGIGELIKDMFRKSIDKVVAFLDGVDWDSVWMSVVDIATDAFNDLSSKVQTIISNIPWADTWDSLVTYAGTLWGLVKDKLTDWGQRFKDEVIPKEGDWAGIFETLGAFAEKIWTEVMAPAIEDIVTVMKAWLPSTTDEWADAWLSLWDFGKELWPRLLAKATDIAKEFAKFIRDTDWSPLITALNDTIGQLIRDAISNALKTGVISGIGGLLGASKSGYVQMLEDSVTTSPTTDGVLPPQLPTESLTPSPGAGTSRDERLQSLQGTSFIFNIANFIGLDDATTRKNLRTALADIDISELQRRGVR